MKTLISVIIFCVCGFADAGGGNSSPTITAIEKRYYASVPALTPYNQDYVVPNGATLVITALGGNSPTANSFSYTEIVWDPAGTPQVVFATYSAGFQQCNMSFVGDGTKVMRISNVNNDPVSSRFIGSFYSGYLSQ